MEAQTMTPGPGLQMMDTEAVNDYLESLLKGKVSLENELELQAIQRFRETSGRVDQLHAALGRAKAQVENFTAEINSSNGELKAYANMLASAEDARRLLAVREKAEAEQAKIEADGTKPTEPEAKPPEPPELVEPASIKKPEPKMKPEPKAKAG